MSTLLLVAGKARPAYADGSSAKASRAPCASKSCESARHGSPPATRSRAASQSASAAKRCAAKASASASATVSGSISFPIERGRGFGFAARAGLGSFRLGSVSSSVVAVFARRRRRLRRRERGVRQSARERAQTVPRSVGLRGRVHVHGDVRENDAQVPRKSLGCAPVAPSP